jgi:hypothetical protein
MYASAFTYLNPYRPEFMDVDVERLLAELQTAFAELLQHHDGYPVGVRLDDKLIPSIELH